ncbi:MAG: carboxypeptidase-like regulatory domain-containing protein, partial [Bacteroidota bacterium]
MKSSAIITGILILIFSFSNFFSRAQTDEIRLSVNFQNKTLKECIHILEAIRGLEFYYLEPDIANKKVNFDCSGLLLPECLENIFRANFLNYHQIGNRVYVFTGEPVREQLLTKPLTATKKQITEKPEKDLDKLKQQSFKIHEIGIPGKNKSNFAVLNGYVTGYETEEPVSNASIIVAGTSQGISTNKNGYYEIRLPIGNNTLQFSSIGMEPTQRIVNIYSDGRLDVQMETKINIIGDIDIYADQNGEVSRVFSGVERIEGEMLESLPALLGEPDVIKSTLMLPGVTTVGEGTAGFNVRGGKTDQNLILIDEAPVFYPSHFFGNFSAINSDMVDNAILFKGSIPSNYGGRVSSV